MGIFNKLKDIFFEEEYVEVEEPEKVEPKEKVMVAKKIETPEIRKKEEPITVEEPNKINLEMDEINEDEKQKDFKFPMTFDDKDFEVEKTIELEEPVKEPKEVEIKEPEPQREVVEEPAIIERETREYRYVESYQEPVKEPKEEKTIYHGLYEGKEVKEKPGFTPSPIISPIYGILNKNYKKEEIVTKTEVRLSQVSTKKADLDLVREKAYGDLAGEISASIEDDKKEPVKEEKKEDLLYDLNEEESPTVKVVTVGDAEEYFNDLGLEYNIDYKVEKEDKEIKEEPKEKKVKKIDIDESSDDDKNLFDLIDSMYEDKE